MENGTGWICKKTYALRVNTGQSKGLCVLHSRAGENRRLKFWHMCRSSLQWFNLMLLPSIVCVAAERSPTRGTAARGLM